MLLPKHPRLMNDEEMSDWAISLIKRRAPESNLLDYKAEISIEGKNKRVEIGKDISSFANEAGGVILYGVPEVDENEVPIPHELSKCGIEIPKDLPSNVENILNDIIGPPLPELHIRVLSPKELAPRSLLLIYHPESWNKPHMIEGYQEARYYRRGNFRAVMMTERQVEAAYSYRKASFDNLEKFVRTGDFRGIPEDCRFLRVVLCPRFPLFRREEMLEDKFRNWLNDNPPNNRRGDWVPFLDGWSFIGHPSGRFYGKQYELRLFHNGALCFSMDLDSDIDENNYLNLNEMMKVFSIMIFPYAKMAFEFLKISGPVLIQVSLYNVRNLNAKFPSSERYFQVAGVTPIATDSITFVEEMSVSELWFNSDNALRRVVNRLASAFGIWQK